MDWRRHLNERRFGDERGPWREPTRSPFEQDQDRIIYSTAFRRLAGKTQVFPLPESDVTHHRMSHTLEVAAAGRSLGRRVAANDISDEGRPLGTDVGAVVAAACLAHDLGNPPFGHSGESAIAAFFQEGPGARLLDAVSEDERSDFTEYEGNALGFRLVTRTKPQRSVAPGGMRLTYATLGAFLKYPRTSASRRMRAGRSPEDGDEAQASEKKFCAFADDREALEDIARVLGLPNTPYKDRWRRHPLAFLVEAADDICNRLIDLEDAFRVKLVTFAHAEALLMSVIDQSTQTRPERYHQILDEQDKIGYLRSIAIGVLISQAAVVFAHHADEIERGAFDRPLASEMPASPTLDAMEEVMRRQVYNSRGVLSVEVAGFQVIGGLLEILSEALVVHPDALRSKKVRALMPTHFVGVESRPHVTVYENLISMTEFVASMTDTYAIDLYRVLTGIELPNY
jgi:dGTPase